jgi:uncharacterized protein YlxP (DUF503 family)
VSSAGSGHVAVLVVELHFPFAGSLKAKRKDLASLKAQLAGRLGVAVAETGFQNLWQRAELTLALTAGTQAAASDGAARVEEWLLSRVPGGITSRRALVSTSDLLDG